MDKVEKQRMFSSDKWRELFDKSKKTASDVEAAVGIPKVVFLRAIQPNGKQFPIPFKYEIGLYDYLKSCIGEQEVVIVTVPLQNNLSQDDIDKKLLWLTKLKEARNV